MTELKLRHETWALAQALVAFAMVMLVMLGIAGMIYRVIAPDGWIAQAFSRSLAAGLTTLCALAVIGALVWFGGPSARNKHSTAFELVVMGLAGAGAIFLLQAGLNGML